MIDVNLFRDGMARLGSAVAIIATNGPAGRHGFTASAVCSVTDTPPTLLVCINRSVSSYAAFQENGVLSVNVLGSQHERLSGSFASKAVGMEERFAGAEWFVGMTGAPQLSDATVSFDCRVSEITDVGTHGVLFCAIAQITIQKRAMDALIWCGRAYHRLPVAFSSNVSAGSP